MNTPFEMSARMQAGLAVLLNNVRTLDKAARQRLEEMLKNDWDMPILDVAEREVSRAMNEAGGSQLGSALRSHYVNRLMTGREYMVEEMRRVINESDALEEENIELAS